MRLPEGVAPRLARPVLADRLQIKGGQVHSFLFPGLNDQAITRAFLGKSNGIKGDGMPIGIRRSIVGQGDGDHVLDGSPVHLGDEIEFHVAHIGNQDQLCSPKHEHPRALWELPVVADHGPHLDRPLRRLQCTHGKAVSRCTRRLDRVKVTGVHLGVGQHHLPVPVDQRHRIARPPRPAFQVSEGDSHAQLLR